jgi:hypothetical protein
LFNRWYGEDEKPLKEKDVYTGKPPGATRAILPASHTKKPSKKPLND